MTYIGVSQATFGKVNGYVQEWGEDAREGGMYVDVGKVEKIVGERESSKRRRYRRGVRRKGKEKREG